MAQPALDPEASRSFFARLYKAPPEPTDSFDRMVTGICARLGQTTVVGDQALQGLMMNFVLQNPETTEKARGLSAALAGIKQRSVNEFARAFPNTSIDDLIESAKAAGYDVEVLA